MKLLKYLLVLTIFSSAAYSKCFICGVVPQEWNLNLHMANNEYADEIKKKKKKKGKKLKGKEKGKKVLGVNGNLSGKRRKQVRL